MLRVYMDDSADQKQERVVTAGAYVGFYHQWKWLVERWRKRLKREGIPFFHTTAYYSLRDEFAIYRDPVKYPIPKGKEAAKRLLDDLEGIIHESEVMGIAICIPMEVYSDVRTREKDASVIFPSDAFQVALISLFKSCVEIARDEFDPSQQLAFTCDRSNRDEIDKAVYEQFRKDNPSLAQFVHSFNHQDDETWPPLQTADLRAHLARRRYIDWLDDPDKNQFTPDEALRTRLKRLAVHKIQHWDRNYIMAVLDHERRRRGLQ
jgi:hypothetical protein